MASPSAPPEKAAKRPAYLATIEEKLRNILGTHVRLYHKKGKGGKIEVEYYSDEDLDRLLEMFEVMEKGW